MIVYVSGGYASESDPYFANVILLLHGDGSNGGTVFTDSSSYNRSIATSTGTINTVTDAGSYGGSAIYFSNSVASYIDFDISDVSMGTSDAYTVECIVDLATQAGDGYTDTRGSFLRFTDASNNKVLEFAAGHINPTDMIIAFPASYAVPVGSVLNRVALSICRHADLSYDLYANGTRAFHIDAGTAYRFNKVRVGNYGSTRPVSGIIEEIRVTVGVARYSGASYTIQTQAFPGN